MNRRMDNKKLNIGAFVLQKYARTEEHIRDAAEGGLDFFIHAEADRDMLDLFHKYGLGLIAVDSVYYWWGGNGIQGKMHEECPVEIYEQAAARFADHPAIWGIEMGDEPSAIDFEHMGKVTERINELFPNQFAIMNLYPNYASVIQNTEEETESDLGTTSYQEYIDRYCKYMPCDHICYDHYPFGSGWKTTKDAYSYRIPLFLENLRVVEDACLKTGRKHWLVIQVNNYEEGHIVSLNQMRYQAFVGMAYGAECLIWACYTAGWWENNILDTEGNKTPQYDKMKQVNREIHIIGEEYMKYRHVDTHLVGFAGHPDAKGVNREPIDSLNTGIFFDVKADNGAPIVVGQMVSRADDDSYALMICAADDSHDLGSESYNITFRTNGRTVTAIGGEGMVPVTMLENGYCSVPVTSNAGVLIIAK